MNAIRFPIRLIAPLAMVLMPIAGGAETALERDKKALDIIVQFAAQLCGTVPLDGVTKQLTADGKLALNSTMSKIVGVGVEGAVKYQKEEFSGPLQKDLAKALEDNTNCKTLVFATLSNGLELQAAEQKTSWRHFSMPQATGRQVAERLTQIGPEPDDVVVAYDGSKNVFHVWFRGGGSETRYRYGWGDPADLAEGTVSPFGFRNDGRIVPAGIGGIAEDAVPIYFQVE